jgi:hypothetical protein
MLEQLVGPYKLYKELQTWIIQERPRRDQDGRNSSDQCSELYNRRFEDHSGQRKPSISQLVGEVTSRHMIPTSRSSNNV